jgi:hypothetical protein
MAATSSALRAGRPLPPRFLFLRVLVLISVRLWVDSKVIVRSEGLGKLEKIYLIGTRSRVLPACSIVPQPLQYSVPLKCSHVCIYMKKKKELYSSETSVDFQRTTRRYIPEDSTLHNHRCENLKSYIVICSVYRTSVILNSYLVRIFKNLLYTYVYITKN